MKIPCVCGYLCDERYYKQHLNMRKHLVKMDLLNRVKNYEPIKTVK